MNSCDGGFGGLARSGAGGGAAIELVQVQQNGGQAGDHDTQCNFMYDIYPPFEDRTANTKLNATPLLPHKPRALVGAYVAAAAGSFGYAVKNPSTGLWDLLEALKEVEDAAVC